MLTSTQSTLKGDEVPFVEWSGELLVTGKLKVFSTGGEARASLNRAYKVSGIDPKPGDLPMGRLKWR